MNHTTFTTLGALALALMLGASHLLDGPDEHETREAVAQEALQAPALAHQQARQEFHQQVAEASRQAK